MAVKTSMRATQEIIAREIAAPAAERGLDRSDFALTGAWQETTGRISLVLGASRTVDWFDWYKAVLERLQASFASAGAPDAASNVGLVVLSPRTRDELYSRFRLADDEEDVTDFLEATIDAAWTRRTSPATQPVVPG